MSADVPSVLGPDFKFVNGKTCREGEWAPVNASHPSLLRNAASLYIAALSSKAAVYQKESEQRTSDSGEEVGVFQSRLPPSGRAVGHIKGGKYEAEAESKTVLLSVQQR